MILINTIKYVSYFLKKLFKKGIKTNINRYDSYEEYLKHQKVKTTDQIRIHKWQNDEWEIKYNGFREIFSRNNKYIKNKNNAICLGARTGQEVKALIDLGVNAIGIDLVAFPPYTVEGDIHNLQFKDNTVDLEFTNIMDHSLYPEIFISEMERVCAIDGIIILHLQLGHNIDPFTENIIHKPNKIINFFKKCKVLDSKSIKNLHDQMHWELILKKII